MERRRYHRVDCSTPAALIHHEIIYNVRLENLCLKGALVSSGECIMVPAGESCSLLISVEESEPPIVATARVAYAFFSMVGVQFLCFADDGEQRLFHLMEKITPEPGQLKLEWEQLLAEKGEASYLPL